MNENVVRETIKDLPLVLNGDREKLVKKAEEIGKELGRTLSTSQIRNVFTEVKQMKFDQIDRLHLMRPKLAYLVGRHASRRGEQGGIVVLQQILDEAIKEVLQQKTQERFDNFKDFFEAILAYHKFYGGKD